MKRVTFAKIRSEDAGPVIRRLMDEGFVDVHAKIGKDGSYRYVPILPERLGEEPVSSMELVEGDAHTLDRRPPQERIGEILGPELRIVGPNFTAPDGHPASTLGSNSPWARAEMAIRSPPPSR